MNFKVIGLTRPGFENARSGIEREIPRSPRTGSGLSTHSATLTDEGWVVVLE